MESKLYYFKKGIFFGSQTNMSPDTSLKLGKIIVILKLKCWQ